MKICCNPEHGELNPQPAKFVLSKFPWGTWLKDESRFLCEACAWIWQNLGHLDREHYSIDEIEEDDPSIVNPSINDDDANRIINFDLSLDFGFQAEKPIEDLSNDPEYERDGDWVKWVGPRDWPEKEEKDEI